MADAVLVCHDARLLEFAADQRYHLDTPDLSQGVQMLLAEGAGAGECDLHRLASIRQNHMAEGGVGCRYMVEAVDLLDLRIERPTHDQPHDELDAFRTRVTHVFQVRDTCERLRV